MNKDLERFYLDEFINKSGLDIQIVDKKREKPDFEIIHDSKMKGIEVCRIFKNIRSAGGSSIAELESFCSEILILAKAIYFQHSTLPINVKALLSSTLPKGHKGKQDVANQIVRMIKAANLPTKPLGQIRIPGNEFIRVLYVTTLPDGVTPRWICVDNAVGWSRKLLLTELTGIVSEKERLLPIYRKDYDSVILLLVADRTKTSGMYNLTEPTNVMPSTSGFERIFLYLYPEDIYRLR